MPFPPLVEGHGGLPKVVVAAADGARFEAYLHGAQSRRGVRPATATNACS